MVVSLSLSVSISHLSLLFLSSVFQINEFFNKKEKKAAFGNKNIMPISDSGICKVYKSDRPCFIDSREAMSPGESLEQAKTGSGRYL